MEPCFPPDHPASRLSAAAAFLFNRMSTINSPRLPGLPILQACATGAEYSRWRRGLRFACESKGTWGFCDGTRPMPMPKTQGSKSGGSQRASSDPLQPTLLDERKTWVRQDREVKLDIFLSLAEEVMEEVLHAGPPLPPSNMNAQQMLAALDRRFTAFKFEDYHHAFCHFLNLHIDTYPSLEEFNFEFQTTIEDLRDYGHPLSNVQACSAYFSKLRCTQNPWVAKKLESWETQAAVPKLEDLMKEAIPWTFKPASTHPSPNLKTESIPEELVEDTSSQSDTDSSLSTASSPSKLHSRQTSNTTAITTHSLEITVHASSEDIAQSASLPRLPATRYVPNSPPCHLTPKKEKSMPLMGPLPPMHRPLPPLPKHILHSSPRARSASPRIMVPSPKTVIPSPKTSAKSTTTTTTTPHQPPQTPSLRLETTHPTLRPKSPTLLDQKEFGPPPAAPSPITPSETKLHPALRVTPPLPSTAFEIETNAAIPWPCTPDRPSSSLRGGVDSTGQKMVEPDALTRLRAMSGGASSTTSLPLRSYAVSTGYERRGVSPPRLQDRPLLRSMGWSSSSSSSSSPPLAGAAAAFATPPAAAASPPHKSFTPGRASTADSLHPQSSSRTPTPTFESLGVPRCGSPEGPEGAQGRIERSRSPVRELVARLSGESGCGGEERERGEKGEKKGRERKKSWSLGGVGLGRFSHGKGVREIV